MAARPSSLGKYTLVRRLGDGGMAQVYLAHTGGLGRAQREVALKVMHPHLVDRPEITSLFFREALVASTLDHPNLVTVLDSGQHQGRCFLAMEFVPGLDLRRLLRAVWSRDEQLPVGVVVAITVAMCAGLHHAHERCDGQGRSLGIVHRDVSPSNVLLSRDGAVKVGDLGVAKAVDSWTAMHSATGTIRGKLGYMAPEQARGGQVDRRADIYSVGTVLFEMLAGRRPLRGDGEVEILHELVFGETPDLAEHRAECDPELVAIVQRAMQRDPAQRFPTALELQQALEHYALQAGCFVTTSALARYVADHCPPPADTSPSVEALTVDPTVDPTVDLPAQPQSGVTASTVALGVEPVSLTPRGRGRARWALVSVGVAALLVGVGAAAVMGMVSGSGTASVPTDEVVAGSASEALRVSTPTVRSVPEERAEGSAASTPESASGSAPAAAAEPGATAEPATAMASDGADPQVEVAVERPASASASDAGSASPSSLSSSSSSTSSSGRRGSSTAGRSRASRRRKRAASSSRGARSALAPGESLFPSGS